MGWRTCLTLLLAALVVSAEAESLDSVREQWPASTLQLASNESKGVLAPHGDRSLPSLQWKPQHPWPPLEFSTRHLVASILCAVAAATCSAAGVGGGGLFVPLFNLVVGFGPKTSTALSQAVVAGGTLVSVIYNLHRKHPSASKPLVDYDLVLLLIPPVLLGISVGVILNVVFPAWLIVLLLTILLAYMSVYTFKKGKHLWELESKLAQPILGPQPANSEVLEEEVPVSEPCENRSSLEQPLLQGCKNRMAVKELPCQQETSYPVQWLKLLQVTCVWGLFFGLQLLKGGKHTPSVLKIDSCDWQYWALNAAQVPITVLLVWLEARQLLKSRDSLADPGALQWFPKAVFLYPSLAFLSGCLIGLLGIGGGMVINPLLLEMGVIPQVTAASAFLLILFSSSMAAAQFGLIGMLPYATAAYYGTVCMAFSFLGNSVVRYFIARRGRTSIIVFALSAVTLTSALLIGILGSVSVVEEIEDGASTNFKPFCER